MGGRKRWARWIGDVWETDDGKTRGGTLMKRMIEGLLNLETCNLKVTNKLETPARAERTAQEMTPCATKSA